MATVDPASLIGRRLGPVEVLSALGRGGMGTVFRARDGLGREVALKLALDPLHRTMCEERFQREGEIAASLDHPGIARVHSAGVAEDLPYVVCELVEGARMLDDAWEGTSLDERARWVVDAARAMGHAHARGVIHRDLKPGNILVDAQGQVKIVDFGVALADRFPDRLTETGTTVGTPLYMSLEQLRGKRGQVTSASDVWSLGVVLYEALTGQRPFVGGNPVELARAIANHSLAPPSRLAAQVPAAIEAVCLKALAAEPGARYADGDELAADLGRALAGERTLAEREGTARLGGLDGRRVIVAGAAGLGSMALGLALLFGARGEPVVAKRSEADAGLGVMSGSAEQAPVADRARSAIDRGEYEEALRLLWAEPALGGQEELAGLRARLFERGRALLTQPEAGGRSLHTVFEIAGVLNEALDDPPDPAFTLAVLDRVQAFEKQSAERLADERVVRLLEGLAEARLIPPEVPGLQALSDFARGAAKPRHQEFELRCYRFLLAFLRLQVDVITPHYMLVDQSYSTLPPLQKGADPCERYLRLRLELSFHSRLDMLERLESQEARRRAFEALGELLRETRPEEMGARTYANALVHFALRGARSGDVSTHYRRALELSPGNPRILALFAEHQLDVALGLSKAGEPQRALERIREARRLGEEALRESQRRGYEEAPSCGWICQMIRGRLVRSWGLLGDRAGGQAVIDSTPDVPWIGEVFQRSLSETLKTALAIHEGALSQFPRERRSR